MGAYNCRRSVEADEPTAKPNTDSPVASATDASSSPSLFVICGPSGVGKGTLLKRIHKEFPNVLATAVSTTTRAPRQGEVDGQHYHFTDVATFEQMIEKNEFLEYAKVHKNYYGTSKAAIKDVSDCNKLCILEIDRNGCINVRKDQTYGSKAKYLFVTTRESDDVQQVIATLRDRLKSRNSENEEQINTRMKTAEAELEFMQKWKQEGKWDYIVSNDDLDEAVQILKSKLLEWEPTIEQKVKQLQAQEAQNNQVNENKIVLE